MSGGRRIDDHKFWAGGASKESPMPMKAKMKQEHSADGVGAVTYYEDTTEKIHGAQELNKKKVHGLPRKEFHRY
jgi:hypothetical protein